MKKLTKSVLKKINNNEIHWEDISRQYILSEDFIRENKDKVNWIEITYNQNLSEEFIREFKYRIHWHSLNYNKLSESFIREFISKFDSGMFGEIFWESIAKENNLSEEFIREYQDKFKFHNFLMNRNKKTFSESLQRLILEKVIDHVGTLISPGYLTPYMLKQYKKLKIMI
jgi:hypothetical protein